MSYAYFQGDEAESLSYFEKMLSQPLNPQDRAQLEELVKELRRKVSEAHQVDLRGALQNFPAANLHTH